MKYNSLMNQEQFVAKRISNILSAKIAFEYVFTCDDFAYELNSSSVIEQTYKKASDLFNPESETSIIAITLRFYMEHLDEAIDLFIENLDDFQALSKLLAAYAEIHFFMQRNDDSFEVLLGKELSENSDYYSMFPISYYKELYHTKGLPAALAEINNDVNIRAFTFYNAAHKKYLSYLPGLRELIESLTPQELSDELTHHN